VVERLQGHVLELSAMAAKLDVQEQNRLPLPKQVEIAADGIHHRLLRSALTLGVIALAVAFLANTLVESDIARCCKRGIQALADERRMLSSLMPLVDQELGPAELARQLARMDVSSWQFQAISQWLAPDAEGARSLHSTCVELQRYYEWYDGLKPGHRRLLVGKRTGDHALILLAFPLERRKLAEAAQRIPLALPAGLLEFAAEGQQRLLVLDRASQALRAAQAKLRLEMSETTLAEWLANVPTAPESVSAANACLRKLGLVVEDSVLAQLVRQAKERETDRKVLAALASPEIAQAWVRKSGHLFEQQEALVALSEDPATARWLVSELGQQGRPLNINDVEVHAAAVRIVSARRVIGAEERFIAAYGERPGLNSMTFWLLVVSFVVCVAGITNAMLISVLERFREIATMKCLGAMDSFIAGLFLMEAAFMGVVGGLLGVLLGGFIGLARMLSGYSDWVWRFLSWPDLLATCGLCIACGLGLATLAALYPAYAAARMPPMAAMRVE
jgi:predicted nucleic acid-binding protein